MTSHEDIQQALRDYLLTLSVCEATPVDDMTPMTLGASTAGYTRTDGGSFLDDGFAKGMEVLASGFTSSANNGSKMIRGVTDSLLTCTGCVLEAADEDRTLEVGLPSDRALEQGEKFVRTVGKTHVVEQYAPGPESAPASPNDMELKPVYFIQVFVPSSTGIEADARYADALRRHFTPKTSIAIGNGDFIRVRADQSTYLGQRNTSVPGFSMIPVTVPLRVRTQITP